MPSSLFVFAFASAAVVVLVAASDHHGSLSSVALRSAILLPFVMVAVPLAGVSLLLVLFAIVRGVEMLLKAAATRRARSRAQYLPAGRVKKVAIIGGGASGIAAAKEALQGGELVAKSCREQSTASPST